MVIKASCAEAMAEHADSNAMIQWDAAALEIGTVGIASAAHQQQSVVRITCTMHI